MNVEGIRETRNAVKRSAHLNDNWKVIINRLCDELEASQRVELSDEEIKKEAESRYPNRNKSIEESHDYIQFITSTQWVRDREVRTTTPKN